MSKDNGSIISEENEEVRNFTKCNVLVATEKTISNGQILYDLIFNDVEDVYYDSDDNTLNMDIYDDKMKVSSTVSILIKDIFAYKIDETIE